MRRRRVALIAIAGLVGSLVLTSCSSDEDSDDSGLGSRQTKVGEVEIDVALRRLDDLAEFEVTLDTHSGSIDADLELSQLSVGGADWSAPTWDGDGPGGHHREGVLRFDAGSRPDGDVRLLLGGFDEDVSLTWER
jgi:hypothetical protein